MSVKITKSEFAWIAIRLLGIYFLVESFVYVLEIGNAIYAVYGSASEAWGVNITDRFDKVVAVSARLALFAVVYFGLALYCLLKGQFLYNLIVRKPDDGEI